MNKFYLKKKLESGRSLDSILELTTGQCGCTIYKERLADYIVQTGFLNDVCYIPDMELNDLPYEKPNLSDEEISDIIDNCYSFHDFIDLCHGDINKAKIVYENCDWQHPSSEYEEMKTVGWGPDYEQPWHGETRWCADDVIGIAKSAGIEMDDEHAEDWWRDHEKEFCHAMVQYGNELLESMIR